MATLIIKTEGMSAYGLQTFDVHRRVNHFPTRSAIMGLLGATMGITRKQHQKLYALSQQLDIAVQVNNCGEKMMDYHTVQQFRSPQGRIQNGTKPTYREYWCDSEHTFAISAPNALIEQLSKHAKSPMFFVFQGRKSCPLTRPLFETIVDEDNPANALIKEGSKGQIYSDVSGDNQIALVQVRDLTTEEPRKFAIRTVYVCAPPLKEGVGNESSQR